MTASLLVVVAFAILFDYINGFHDAAAHTSRFRRLRVLSAGYMAFSHRSNDAQKTMGLVTLALFSAGVIRPSTSRSG